MIDHENGCQWLASHAVVLLARQAILPDAENETNPFIESPHRKPVSGQKSEIHLRANRPETQGISQKQTRLVRWPCDS